MLQVKSFEFNPIQENTYILYNEFNECIFIDPGCYHDAEKTALSEFIKQKKLVPKILLNTHCHLDHVLGNEYVAKEYELELQFHENEKPVFDFAPASGLMYDLPFVNHIGTIKYIKEGDTIKLGNDELKVLLTPGHSPGSVSFYCAADGFVISGDALFNRSIGRSDLPGGDGALLLKSIREQLFTLPAQTKVYSGHGQVTTIGEEMRENPFF